MKISRRQMVEDHGLDACVPDPVLRRILLSRGVHDPQDLDPSLEHLLHFKQLQDITKASETIAEAVINKEHIRVMGDYDVDGMTGTALGVLCLKAFGLENVSFQVPSRYDNGYGLSVPMVEKAASDGVQLIVTVDNGISCHEAVARARDLGLKAPSPWLIPSAMTAGSPPKISAVWECSFTYSSPRARNLSPVAILRIAPRLPPWDSF